MKIFEMKLTGDINPRTKRPYATATISRYHHNEFITIKLISVEGEREHLVEANNPDDVFSMAQCLQYHLDGCHGTNSMIHSYYHLLEYFTD